VTVSAVIVVLLAVLFLVLFLVLLLVGGSHGPWRHVSSADPGTAGPVGAQAVVRMSDVGDGGVRAVSSHVRA
jgi:hypothetical protein